jgi:uncharacterized heparinase superfamily protein
VADAGPLGYLSIAAHGHADALAIVMSSDGRELFIDPGTYAYHTEKRWRDYFRGTAAHNTVRIDGQDQSVIGGNFMWLQKARARCLAFESTPERDRWVAEHDGYRRLADPVTHRRSVTLHKAGRSVEVVDTLACAGTHAVELHWHVAPEWEVEQAAADTVLLRGHGQTWRLRCASWNAACTKGRSDPPLGWISRRFDRKEPSWTVCFSGDVRGTASITTSIEPVAASSPRAS